MKDTVGAALTAVVDFGVTGAADSMPLYNIIFQNKQGRVGALDFNGPSLKFEGNAEESARAFLDSVAKDFERRLSEEYARGYQAARAAQECPCVVVG